MFETACSKANRIPFDRQIWFTANKQDLSFLSSFFVVLSIIRQIIYSHLSDYLFYSPIHGIFLTDLYRSFRPSSVTSLSTLTSSAATLDNSLQIPFYLQKKCFCTSFAFSEVVHSNSLKFIPLTYILLLVIYIQ